jgi:hypothetical protein
MRTTIILFFGILSQILFGQNAPVTKAPEITCDPGTIVQVPITVSNFYNIGAFSLTMHYESPVLVYQSFTNNSGFPNLMINGAVAGEITASGLKFGTPGVTLPDNSILFTLTFLCQEGSTGLLWYDDGISCEYTDDQYNPLNDLPTHLFYHDGSVNQSKIQLGLKLYLEGAFSGTEMTTVLNDLNLIPTSQPYTASPWSYDGPEVVLFIPENAVDWVLIQLRQTPGDASTATPDKTVATRAGFLMKNGSVKDVDGINNLEIPVDINSNLFVVVYHRNHLSAMSSNPVPIFNWTGFYDFSTGETKVFGGSLGHKEISPGIWGLSSGDSNGDGTIDVLDKQNEWEQIVGFLGYLSSDFSLDAQVDNKDKNDFWKPNFGFASQVP